jgi:uncharacterized protein (TIGR02145 family)
MKIQLNSKGVAGYAPIFTAILAFAITFTLNACGDDGSSGNENNIGNNPIRKDKISGLSQKGPFIKGSTATLYELDNNFAQTGRSFRDIIADDKGSFEIKNVELVSPYAMLEADGFYRNEVTGKISTAPIKLYAIADIREKDNINVNILTHLEYYRIQKLVENGKSLAEAKKQAQREILSVFGISGNFGNSEDMSIFGTSEGDAALLAISVLLQGNLSEGQFTERLTDFSLGFRETGVWNNEAAKNAMADWAAGANLADIKNNILSWELSPTVPAFEKFVIDYWYASYGLGSCNTNLQNNIKKSNRGVDYVCQDKAWRMAMAIESELQLVCLASNESMVKKSNINTTYYICKSNAWQEATELEYDTYQWVCSTEGEMKKGNVSEIYYICKNDYWQIPRYVDIKCNDSKSCLIFTDTRDNQSYYSVEIGEQTWMAENLNYDATGSKCYDNNLDNCDKYGRLYDWATAMEVCPFGWHLPNNEDWDALYRFVDGSSGTESPYSSTTAGKYLKATSGWDNYSGIVNLDSYGFSALPGGYRFSDGSFYYVGVSGLWWSASSDVSYNAYSRYMTCDGDGAYYHYDKNLLRSVRCVKRN